MVERLFADDDIEWYGRYGYGVDRLLVRNTGVAVAVACLLPCGAKSDRQTRRMMGKTDGRQAAFPLSSYVATVS